MKKTLLPKKQFIMSALELKNDIFQILINTNDSNLLAEVKEAVVSIVQGKEQSDWWDTISDKEKQSIERGIKDIEAGRVISNEEMEKHMKQKIEQLRNKQ